MSDMRMSKKRVLKSFSRNVEKSFREWDDGEISRKEWSRKILTAFFDSIGEEIAHVVVREAVKHAVKSVKTSEKIPCKSP